MSEKTTTDATNTVAQLPTQHDDQKFVVTIEGGKDLKTALENPNLKNIEKLEAAPVNLAMQYFDFDQGKPERFMFCGIQDMPTQDGEMLPAVILADKTGNFFSNMAILLVSAFINNRVPKFTLVEITYMGDRKKKTGQGSVRTWRVSPLATA